MSTDTERGRRRRGLWGSWVLGLALLAAWVGQAARADEEVTRGAVVRWDAGLEGLGRRAESVLPAIRAEVDRRLGWAHEGPVAEVVIVRGFDRMCAEARARVPRWAVGVTVASRSLIVIRSDLLSAGFGGSLAQVIRHEWVHLAWGRFAGLHRRALPLWAEEGLAEEIGGGISLDAGAALDLAVAFGRLLDFETLETRFPRDPKGADLAYKQSRSWIQFTVHHAGWPAFQGVLKNLAQGVASGAGREEEAFSAALEERTGRSLADWHLSWRVTLEEEATPWLLHLLLRDFQGILLACLGVVAMGAFLFVLRRRRRSIQELPDLPLPEEGPSAPI